MSDKSKSNYKIYITRVCTKIFSWTDCNINDRADKLIHEKVLKGLNNLLDNIKMALIYEWIPRNHRS